jgi:hypothetical protein
MRLTLLMAEHGWTGVCAPPNRRSRRRARVCFRFAASVLVNIMLVWVLAPGTSWKLPYLVVGGGGGGIGGEGVPCIGSSIK